MFLGEAAECACYMPSGRVCVCLNMTCTHKGNLI